MPRDDSHQPPVSGPPDEPASSAAPAEMPTLGAPPPPLTRPVSARRGLSNGMIAAIVAGAVVLTLAAGAGGVWVLSALLTTRHHVSAEPPVPTVTYPHGTEAPTVAPTTGAAPSGAAAPTAAPPTGGNAPPPSPVYYWGAIAVAANGGSGRAWDARSQGDAEQKAMGECGQASGSDCTVLTSFANGCGAVAYNRGTNRYWGGNGSTLGEAQSAAVSNAGGGSIYIWQCTTGHG